MRSAKTYLSARRRTPNTQSARRRTARTASLAQMRYQNAQDKLQISILLALGITPANARRAIKLSREATKHQAATVISKRWRAHVEKRFKDLQAFKKDLQSHMDTNNNKSYYGSLIDKIATQTMKILKDLEQYNLRYGELPTYTNFKHRVNTNIGPCHVEITDLPVPYLKNIVNGLYFVSHEYSKMSASKKVAYMSRAAYEMGGRPCIENFIEALQSSLYEPAMLWTGRNITPLVFPARTPNRSAYLGVMARAIGSYITNNTRAKLVALPSNNARIKKFWSVVKNKQLSVINANGNPAYIAVKNYNKNGRTFKNSGPEAANYVTLNEL